MLVLSRKINEKIVIGEQIEITVVSVSGDTVRLGISAPSEVKILRKEVYEEIERQNKIAATKQPLNGSIGLLKSFGIIHE